MSCWNALIKNLICIISDHKICVYKLCHFNVVCHNIDRVFFAFSNCYKFMSTIMGYICGIFLFSHRDIMFSKSTIFKSCYDVEHSTNLVITIEISQFYTTWLFVKELSQTKCSCYWCIVTQLMQQESINMVIEKSHLNISVTPRLHVFKDTFVDCDLRSDHLCTFTHCKHWEIIIVCIIFVFHVIKANGKWVMIFGVWNALMTITWNINSIHLI